MRPASLSAMRGTLLDVGCGGLTGLSHFRSALPPGNAVVARAVRETSVTRISQGSCLDPAVQDFRVRSCAHHQKRCPLVSSFCGTLIVEER